ncbi:alpha/beta hydrolase [Brevundimonas diminuta]|uniref:alpha/beta fold hydrolase n=1 Tax=Brevundimonas diminuta TaxID=293 RepID=UPI00320B01FD
MHLSMLKTLFLPGAAGSSSFWRPVASKAKLDGVFFSWPGLGNEPAAANVSSIEDIIALAATEINEPVAIVAQSMGGYVAIKLALKFPELVKLLVLTVTSGGIPTRDLGAIDWRTDYYSTFPRAASWITDPVEDLSADISTIQIPTLLLWGDADPISPVAVGEHLSSLLPNSRLRVFAGANHDLAQTHAEAVADEVRRHLMTAS